MPRRYANRKLKGRSKQRNKKLFKHQGPTNKLYHPSIARTLQLATKRHNSQMLRFTKNMTWKIDPQSLSENIFLTIRANSIFDLMYNGGAQNQPGTWSAQDDNSYGPTVQYVNCDSYETWAPRYQHYTVLGSKIQVTYEPTDCGYNAGGESEFEPCTLYVNLAGIPTAVDPLTACKDVVKLPYLKRAAIHQGFEQHGKRLFQFYSAKRFESVKDIMDNQNLRGTTTGASGAPGTLPQEQSYYTVGIVPTITNNLGSHASNKIPGGIMRIKLEYITKLTEPTLTNEVSA